MPMFFSTGPSVAEELIAMPRCPFATWEPATKSHGGTMTGHLGVVAHVNESTGDIYNWCNNPGNQVSSHFQVMKDGSLLQYVDTDVASWCQSSGNYSYLSVETEGYHTEAFTPAQVETFARLMAWAHQVHEIPLTLADVVGQRGLGWHGMGGKSWGGHTSCPGEPRKAQRAVILQRAAQLLSPPPVTRPSSANQPTVPAPSHPPFSGRQLFQPPALYGLDVHAWQMQMARRGWDIGTDGWYGPASEKVARAFQAEKHLTVDGVVGAATWDAAWTASLS
jgi:N-acetyl-anhydromuramyl-L-alanine amidase AmpD